MSKYIESKTFLAKDFTENELPKGEYEECNFLNCVFTASNLSGITFINCSFEGCDLSNTKLGNTSFQDTKFKNSKLLGLQFSDCNPFLLSLHFEGCLLDFSSFYQLNLKGSTFKYSTLKEVDFTESNLKNIVFQDCELMGAIFENSVLEGTDFRRANDYSINLAKNKIKKAKFSSFGIKGLLDSYDIIIE